MKTMLSILLTCFVLTMNANGEKPKSTYHKIEARKGDGIYKLLKRYKLDIANCNLDAFCDLNSISKNTSLIQGKEYTLPVMIYTYNGKSIRSTIGDDDFEKAVRIKEYNEYLKERKLRKTHYVDSKILWVPFHELNCAKSIKVEKEIRVTKSESGKTYKEVKIFGKKHAKIEVVDQRLKGHVYYLVSGHGGPDPGAMCEDCPKDLCEDEYAYDVTLRIARNFLQHGADVEIIVKDPNDGIRDDQLLKCDRDEVSNRDRKIPLNQIHRLWQRTDDINTLYSKYKKKGAKKQQAIFVHVDSRSTGKSQDVFFYHFKGSKTGKKMAYSLQNTFKKKYDKFQKNRGYKGYVSDKRNLYVLRNTYPAAVFIELANIQNRNDHKRLKFESNRQALANWIFEGIIKQ